MRRNAAGRRGGPSGRPLVTSRGYLVHFVFQPVEETLRGSVASAGGRAADDGADGRSLCASATCHSVRWAPSGCEVGPDPVRRGWSQDRGARRRRPWRRTASRCRPDRHRGRVDRPAATHSQPRARSLSMPASSRSAPSRAERSATSRVLDEVVLTGTIRSTTNLGPKPAGTHASARSAPVSPTAFCTDDRMRHRRRLSADVINHPEQAAAVEAAAHHVVGPELLDRNCKPVMASEDFAFLLERVPRRVLLHRTGRPGAAITLIRFRRRCHGCRGCDVRRDRAAETSDNL